MASVQKQIPKSPPLKKKKAPRSSPVPRPATRPAAKNKEVRRAPAKTINSLPLNNERPYVNGNDSKVEEEELNPYKDRISRNDEDSPYSIIKARSLMAEKVKRLPEDLPNQVDKRWSDTKSYAKKKSFRILD